MKLHRPQILLAACLILAPKAWSEPDLRTARAVGPCVVYRDDRRADLFFFGPGDIALRQSAEGEPDLHFLQTRYTGSATTGDSSSVKFHSLLTFGVTMNGPSLRDIQATRDALVAERVAVNPELRPLPIQRLEAGLIYSVLGRGDESGGDHALPSGHFEEAPGQAGASPAPFWSQRTYSLRLDPHTAQAFAAALKQGQVLLSVGFAFYATGIAPDKPLASLAGTPALRAELHRSESASGESQPPGPRADVPKGHLIKAGSTGVTLDVRRWPNAFRQVDLNEGVPPGYPVLEVRCYDFRDRLRPELQEKRIEIEGLAVGRGTARLTVRFGMDQPDLFAQRARFPVAVRLQHPYRYRTTEIGSDGGSRSSEWKRVESWNPVLDVTTETVPGAESEPDTPIPSPPTP